MIKNIKTIAALGILSASTASFGLSLGTDFIVDECVFQGCAAGSQSIGPIDRLIFSYEAGINQENDGGPLNGDAFTEDIFISYTGYADNNGVVIPSSLGALNGYNLYAIIENATGTAAVQGTGIDVTFTSFNYMLFADPGQDTSFNFPVGYDAAVDAIAPIDPGAEGADIKIASAVLSVGEANLFAGLANGDFDLNLMDFKEIGVGAAFFEQPDPFLTETTIGGNTESVSPAASATAPFTAIANGGGPQFFNPMPEPASIALLGAGLLGLFASNRRRLTK